MNLRDYFPELQKEQTFTGDTGNMASRYETRDVLAGAYLTGRRGLMPNLRQGAKMLTHTLDTHSNKVLCGKIKSEKLADAEADPEGVQQRPTCPMCAKRDPRFKEKAANEESLPKVMQTLGLLKEWTKHSPSIQKKAHSRQQTKAKQAQLSQTMQQIEQAAKIDEQIILQEEWIKTHPKPESKDFSDPLDFKEAVIDWSYYAYRNTL